MNTKQLTDPTLISGANILLSAHIKAHVKATIDELFSHLPAIKSHFDNPVFTSPKGVPTWAFAAMFEATDDYHSVSWGALRGSLLSRAYSMISGCSVLLSPGDIRTSPVPLSLWKALVGADLIPYYYDISENEDETTQCAHVSGSVLARALGIALFERCETHFKTIESDTKRLFL